jgi:hypothetical protein
MEEYYDYVFPEEAGVAPNLKLLEAAMRWKRQKLMGAEKEEEQQRQQDEEQGQEQEQIQEGEEQGDGGEDEDGY